MKELGVWVAAGAMLILVVVAVIFGIRTITQVATPITVHEVRPGVLCALATTSDGAAISCWKDKP